MIPPQVPVHEPADISGKLLRFRARQYHAEIQRMEEAPFRNPVFFLDQVAMHDRNLSGGPAETDKAQLKPVQGCLAERNRRRSSGIVHVG